MLLSKIHIGYCDASCTVLPSHLSSNMTSPSLVQRSHPQWNTEVLEGPFQNPCSNKTASMRRWPVSVPVKMLLPAVLIWPKDRHWPEQGFMEPAPEIDIWNNEVGKEAFFTTGGRICCNITWPFHCGSEWSWKQRGGRHSKVSQGDTRWGESKSSQSEWRLTPFWALICANP